MAEAVLQAPPDIDLAETRRIPGNKGIWAGITCEFVEFAVLSSRVTSSLAPIFPMPSTKARNGCLWFSGR